MSDLDHFADVRDTHIERSDFGSLGGDGATEAFSVNDTAISADGPVFTFGCLSCGKGMQVIPTWQEVAIVRCRLSPQDNQTGSRWPLIDGAFVAPVTCPGCGKPCRQAAMSPDAADRFLRKGIAAGILDTQWVNQAVTAITQQARAQGLVR